MIKNTWKTIARTCMTHTTVRFFSRQEPIQTH